MGMSTGAWKVAPLAGLVMRTTGGRFVGGGLVELTVMLTMSERVDAPPLSVATAVSMCGPAGGLDQRRNQEGPVVPFTPGGSMTTCKPGPRSMEPSKNSTLL